MTDASNDSYATEARAITDELLSRLGPEEQETARCLLSRLAERPVDALAPGDAAPDFELPNIHGQPVSLAECLRRGPVVLSFFRGAWCSFCNLELRALQRRLPQIEALGATLLALSPQRAEHSSRVAERHNLGYQILVDASNRVAKIYGLVVEDGEAPQYDERRTVAVSEWNAERAEDLPVPATYVVEPGGTIIAGRTLADWTQRMEPDEIVDVLRSLAEDQTGR